MALVTSLLKLLGGAKSQGAQSPAAPGVELKGSQAAPAVRVATLPPAGRRPSAGEPEAPPAPEVAGPLSDEVDRRFSALLLGIGMLRAAECGAGERRVISQVEELAGGSGDASLVPRLPFVLPRLMSLLRREDVAPRELAEHLAPDPTLVGEVVRLANSPRYRTDRDITDLQEAVMVLGHRGLSQIVISATMRPIFSTRQGRFSRVAGTRLWDVTERCSSACACLGGDAVDRFQAYLAGMAANIGLIAVLRVLDHGYREQQAPDTVAFHDALRDASAKLSGLIARQWNFPPPVCQAVLRHADPGCLAGGDELTRVLHRADRLAKWHLLSPGLSGDALAGLSAGERRCYLELERAFAGS